MSQNKTAATKIATIKAMINCPFKALYIVINSIKRIKAFIQSFFPLNSFKKIGIYIVYL